MNDLFYRDRELIKKDEHQWDAYQAMGNTAVIAGPGSGKTRVLTLKAIKIIKSELSETCGLACLSYSRETVRELRNRLDQYAYRASPLDYIGTVHGFCLAEIITPFQQLYPEYKIPYPLKIASATLKRQIYLGVIKDLGIEEAKLSDISLERERYLSITGSSKVNLVSDPAACAAAEMYEDRLIKSGHLDFTRMAKLATKMIQEKEYIRNTLEAKYPWLLIDEYQDLGKALHEMVLTLQSLTDIKIFVVGDMDQSIYGFQGAYPDFLKEVYQNNNFNPIQLKFNYRSNQDMISASIAALDPPPPQPNYTAKLRNNEQAEFTFITCNAEMSEQFDCVAGKVIPKLIEKGIPHNEIAIIVGSNNEAAELVRILREHDIPSYIARWNFDFQSDIVQWLMECAQWNISPQKNSFEKIFTYWNYLLIMHDDPRILLDVMNLRIDFLEVLNGAKSKTVLKDWLPYIIGSLELGGVVRDSERYPDERENLEKIIEESKNGTLKGYNLEKFLRIRQPQNEVTVTTRHSVKGLEFEAIVMLGMEEGRFPYYLHKEGSQELQEAHRLCYVCVSRAKKVCILLHSLKITFDTRNGPWTKNYFPSRFWKTLHTKYGNENNTFEESDY